MSSGVPANQRKVFLINPGFQLRVLGWMGALCALVLAVSYGASWYFFHKFELQGMALGLPANHVFFEFLDGQRREMNYIFLGSGAVIAVLVSVVGVLMSHRIAGPMYRLKKHMRMVADGETTENVKFRKGDFFPEIADGYNEQMERFRKLAKKKPAPRRVA